VKAQPDTLVAVCALLIAAIAAGASAYQTYVINEQFSATVWPYLSFDTTSDSTNDSFVLGVRNVGLGPAVIRSTIVTVDGRVVGGGSTGNPVDTALIDAVKASSAAEAKRHQRGLVRMSTSSLSTGDVIPAGSSTSLLRAQGPDLFKSVKLLRPHFDIAICYCSVLGRCWTRRLQDKVPEPKDVRSCPLPE
jgi:hypothetical protein